MTREPLVTTELCQVARIGNHIVRPSFCFSSAAMLERSEKSLLIPASIHNCPCGSKLQFSICVQPAKIHAQDRRPRWLYAEPASCHGILSGSSVLERPCCSGRCHRPRTHRRTEIADRAADAEIVLTNKAPLSRETIATLPQLKYVGVMATGTNIVDLKAASEHGVTVTNVPGYSTMSVPNTSLPSSSNFAPTLARWIVRSKLAAGRHVDFASPSLPSVNSMAKPSASSASVAIGQAWWRASALPSA